MENAGNVLLPRLELKLSFRLPPSADAEAAAAAVKQRLEADPPYGVCVRFDVGSSLAGWDAPPVAPWLEASMRDASRAMFGQDAMYLGTGGSIPFIGMLGERFPGHAVPGDGRAGSAFECARAERVPAPRLRGEADGVRRQGDRRSPRAPARLGATSRGRAGSARPGRPAGPRPPDSVPRDAAVPGTAAGYSPSSKSSRSTRGGRPFGNLDRLVNMMRPSTGTSPASSFTAAMRSYSGFQRVQEGGALAAVHHRPFAHVLAAEHDALDVPVIDHQQASAREQQEVDVQLAAAAVRNQDVAQHGRGNRFERPDDLLARPEAAPAPVCPGQGDREQRGKHDRRPWPAR